MICDIHFLIHNTYSFPLVLLCLFFWFRLLISICFFSTSWTVLTTSVASSFSFISTSIYVWTSRHTAKFSPLMTHREIAVMTCCISISRIHHWNYSLTILLCRFFTDVAARYSKSSFSHVRNDRTAYGIKVMENWSKFFCSISLSAVLWRTSFGNQWVLWLYPRILEMTLLRIESAPISNPILCTLFLLLLLDASPLIGVCVVSSCIIVITWSVVLFSCHWPLFSTKEWSSYNFLYFVTFLISLPLHLTRK